MKIIYIDTETTGLDPKRHGLTELACIVEIDGEVKETLVLNINPFTYNKEIEVTSEALELTGKTRSILQSYENSHIQFETFIKFLDKYINRFIKTDKFTIAGYNVKFDIDFIKAWFEDNSHKYFGSYFNYKDIDVFSLVKILKLLGHIDTSSDNLETICNYYGINIDSHKALEDIQATKELFEFLTKKYICEKK